MKKQGIVAGLFTLVMLMFVVMNVWADKTDLSDDIAAGEERLGEIESLYGEMQEKIDSLEENKENLSNYLASLNQSYEAAQTLIDTYNGQISEKQADIDAINEKLKEAEHEQAEQYEAMKLRIQYMYESGDMDIINVFLSDGTIEDMLNQVEYISKIMEYDRSKMDEYENLLLTITVMKQQAEEEMNQLSTLKSEQESVVSDLAKLMDEASLNIKAHQEQISAAEQEALAYEQEIENQRNSLEELKQEESRRVAESISESIRESEEASRRQAAIDAGETYEEEFEFDDDMTDDEINGEINDWAEQFLETWWEEYE